MNSVHPEPVSTSLFSPASARRGIVWLLVGLLLFFGQVFHYIIAFWPLWALSKAFPIISLPAALALRHYSLFPMSRQILLSWAWLILAPSLVAGVYFHQNFFTSITAQVKLLPLLYFFSFLAVLLTLKPTLYEIERSFIRLAITVAGTVIVFWIVIPDSWYSTTYVVGDAPFFSHDHRGNRIRMSMYFPIIALFFCFRRAVFEKSLSYLTGAITFLLVIIFIIKTRSMVIGIMGVLALNTFLWSRPAIRFLLMIIVPVVLVMIFSVGYLGTTFSSDASSGFDTRKTSITLATRFLGDDPIRWIFGVGTISPTSQDSLMSYFHHFFFLADITWLGVVFEYGLIGAILLLLLSIRGLFMYRRLQAYVEDDFLGSLRDYLIYVLLISSFYPITLTPGESTVIFAIFVYVWYAGDLGTNSESRSLNAQNSHL